MDYASLIAAGEKFGFTGEDLRNFVSEEQKKQREEKRIQLLELRRQEKETAEIQLEIERQRNAKSESSSDGIRARSPELPRFYEDKDNIYAYLQRFERYAQSQSWPTTDWAMNLSALLTGKALDVHARLTSDEAKDYRTLKTALLKAFQLTAEGFHSKFYSGKPANGETASQYANILENYLTRWIELSSINHRYEGLFDLLLREHFMNGCHRATVHTTRPEGKTYTPQTPPRPRTPQTCTNQVTCLEIAPNRQPNLMCRRLVLYVINRVTLLIIVVSLPLSQQVYWYHRNQKQPANQKLNQEPKLIIHTPNIQNLSHTVHVNVHLVPTRHENWETFLV
ncbi:uncharacterized protein LOC135153199 isoform X3 [Lytechinus pictus]|uniref:uncharacterized protein LOC135153199 isoform X3 n=1 Tax=Lytechinus pictus TaxID=7653 RepID=UPI0030B9AD8B